MINGRKIGLCLGSGGARGLAHIGVLQVLEENGIVPDIISGCSAGAIIGSVYAAGTNLYLLEKFMGTVEAKDILDLGFPIHGGGILSGDKIEELVRILSHDLSFGETKIPFVCIATDLVSGEMRVFEEGKLHRAVRASMAVPGVFTPAVIDGHYYVDGGVYAELPVSVLRERGADVIITSDLGIKRNFFDPEHPSPVDILRRSSDIMQAQMTRRQADKGDVIIRPDASFMGLLNTNGYEESVAAGRQKTTEALPRIFELLGTALPEATENASASEA
jgi:NTE family protein